MLYSSTTVQNVPQHQSWFGSLLLLPLCIYFCIKGETVTILDTASLLLYDGVGFLTAFTSFELLNALAGTVALVLIPLTLVGFFVYHNYGLGIQVFLFWLGQNLLFLAPHITSLRNPYQELEAGVRFDWHYLLGRADLYDYADVLGGACILGALLTFVVLLVVPRFLKANVE